MNGGHSLDKEELYSLIDEIIPDQPIALSDIPDIELYIDQVTDFIEKKLSLQKRHSKDKLLTKTMINNYAKAGILIPPRRKRYSRQHIALLLLLYNSKQVLSINDISLLFSILRQPTIKHDESEDAASNSWIDLVYNLVQEINDEQAEQLKQICARQREVIREKTSGIDDETRELTDWFLMAMFLISQAGAQKRLAETIIDRHFKDNSPTKGKSD
jgi:DNA-binding transcriptional MerR regulator